MAFLEITGLSKSFKDHKVIRDLSIEVEKGEFLVVFGPSGCGKTVLLRLIAGMMPPDCGDIAIDGQSVVDVNPEDRDIGMAFQNYALYPHMTAFDNIASPLRSRHVTEAEVASAGQRDGAHAADRPCARSPAEGAVARPEAAHRAGAQPGRAAERRAARRPAAKRRREDPLRDAVRAAARPATLRVRPSST